MTGKEKTLGVRIERPKFDKGLKNLNYNYQLYASPDYHFTSDKIDAVFQEHIKNKEKDVLLGEATLYIPNKEHEKADFDFFFPTRSFARSHGPMAEEYPIREKLLSDSGIAEKVMIHMIDDSLEHGIKKLTGSTSQPSFDRFMRKHGVEPSSEYVDGERYKRYYISLNEKQLTKLRSRLSEYLDELGISEA